MLRLRRSCSPLSERQLRRSSGARSHSLPRRWRACCNGLPPSLLQPRPRHLEPPPTLDQLARSGGTPRTDTDNQGRPRYHQPDQTPPGSSAGSGTVAEYAKEVLVEPEWLEQHLRDDSIRIVEVDENPALYRLACYRETHIPGAIGFDWKLDLQDQVKRDFRGPGESRLFRTPGDLQRPSDHPVRRSQQLVRRIHVLVPEVLRARQRQATRRPARTLDLRRAPGHNRATELEAHKVHGEIR